MFLSKLAQSKSWASNPNQRQALKNLLIVLVIASLLPLIFTCNPLPESVQLPDEISFNFDIRPVLSNNCYVCHGPDSSTRQADFRLDLRHSATKHLDDGSKAILPGNWKKSVLISQVTSSDLEFMMPPPEMKRHLSDREIALLKRWIDEGAKWEPYWAFIPPTESPVPTSLHDLHATMLHLLGIEHEHLTFRFSGRDIRLTDIHGHVIHDILS